MSAARENSRLELSSVVPDDPLFASWRARVWLGRQAVVPAVPAVRGSLSLEYKGGEAERVLYDGARFGDPAFDVPEESVLCARESLEASEAPAALHACICCPQLLALVIVPPPVTVTVLLVVPLALLAWLASRALCTARGAELGREAWACGPLSPELFLTSLPAGGGIAAAGTPGGSRGAPPSSSCMLLALALVVRLALVVWLAVVAVLLVVDARLAGSQMRGLEGLE